MAKPCRQKNGRFMKCPKGRKGTKRKSASGRRVRAIYFDGTHCRDSEGAFVPVAQCRGKRMKKKP